jgi:glycosyltransferase involved in cell wall biosynthesis/ribosomal protein S18 acetylase RimI-like enzyme
VEVRVSRPVKVAHVATVDLTVRFLLLPQLRRLRNEGYEVSAISAPGPWTAGLLDEGIRHIPWLHATRSWDPVADARALAELVSIFRRERFDLVHTHNPKPGVLGRMAARVAGVPVVVNTVHGLYAAPTDRPARKMAVLTLESLAARFSDLELYQSEEDLAWARRIGLVRAGRNQLLGNGTDLSVFDPEAVSEGAVTALRGELGIPEDAPVVGTVGRLVAEKGYREFFTAACKVRAVRPQVRFVALGAHDPNKADAIAPGEVRAAARDVIFAGWREDLPAFLALVDVFVLASWREGMPRSAIEAAAMGKPLVLTDIRGSREVARHDVEGLLVPPRNPVRLAGAIEALLSDASLRARLGAAARARARERFDERRVIDTIVDRYQVLLRGRGPVAVRPDHEPHAFTVRRALRTDAADLARLHRESLPGAFLPALGDRFLRRLYRAMAEDRDAIALVAGNGEGVMGFATGALSVRRFYRRFVIRHGLPAAVVAAPMLIRPGVFRRARETGAYPSRASELPDPELFSIAVDPGWRARGVGRVLADGVVQGLGEMGASRVKVVVAESNQAANRFYERIGFTRRGRIEVHRGTPSAVWVIGCHSL